MPIVYIPRYIPDVDYRLLILLDKLGGKSDISFYLFDKMNTNPKYIEKGIRRLHKEGMLLVKFENSVIVEIELTHKAQRLLAEHILGQTTTKRR